MKVLYLVNMNENNRKGLFTATNERLKHLVKCENIEGYDIYSIQFVDAGLMKFLKKIKNKPIRSKGKNKFINDGLTYNKIYIKVGLTNKILEKLNLDILNYLPMLTKYKKMISKFDLISTHWGYPHGRIAYFINKLYKKDYIVSYHGSDVHTMPYKNTHIKNQILEVMNSAYKNIFVSNKLYLDAKELGYKKDNYIVSKNGVDTNKFYPLDAKSINTIKNELNLKSKVIGFVGSLNKIKRADKLIEIFDNINKSMSNEEVSFLVVGDGELKNSMTEEAKSKNLDVKFVGNVNIDKVYKYMNIMDVMVLPSKNEGFGCVIIEANACGTVVVASNVGGISEAMLNDDLLVDEGNDFELRFANKVCDVLNSDFDKMSLIENTKDRFSWTVVSKDESNIYIQ